MVLVSTRAPGAARAGAPPVRGPNPSDALRAGRAGSRPGRRFPAARSSAGCARRGAPAAGRSPSDGREPDRQRAHPEALRAGGGAGGGADPRRRAGEGGAGARGGGGIAPGPRAGGHLWRASGAVHLLLLFLLRLAGGRVPRRQPGAARAAQRRGGCDRGARRLHPAQRRPRGGRSPGRAAPALRQGPPRARDRRPADRAHPARSGGLGRGGARAGRGQGGQHPAPGHAHPRPALRAALRGRAGGTAAPDAGGWGRASQPSARRDRRARGARPRLVRGTGRLDGRRGGRRVLRCDSLCAPAGPRRPPVRRQRDRHRLRSHRRARRDRGQARGAVAAALRAEDQAPWRAPSASPTRSAIRS